MIIDAFLFLDWTKVSLFLNEITDDLICRGLDSFTQKNQHDTNFFPISISEQYGNPFGLLYWLDRCGYSTGKDSSLPNFAMIQLWQIDDLMLKLASTSSISPESCPCIVRKILLLKNTSTTLSDSSLRGNCLEEILLNLATSHEGSLSLLSTLGFRNLIAFKEEKVQTQSLLLSQEAKQMIFSLQAFQSASATATATDSSFVPPQNMKFQVTSIMRPILTATSEQRFAIKEFIHFKNKLQNIFFSSNSTTTTTTMTTTTWMTTGHYARLISYVNDFSVHYIRNSRNHFETSRLLHWLSELLLPCTTGYRSGIFVVDHCCPSSCLLLYSSPATGNNNTTNTSLMKFLDLVQILITNAPNSSNLSILRSVIYDLRKESLLPQDFIPLESPSTRTATTASVMQSMYQTIILIFVTPEDVLEAELFVASWRSSIPTPKHLYSYHIIPTEDCLLLLSRHKTQVSSSRRPCLRSVLLNLEQWMNEFTSNQDRVVVLIGIESLSTLVYSSSNSSSNKIFLAESHHLRMENSTLFSLIFAAAAPSSLQNPPSANSAMKLGDILDFRAFTGFAQAIKQMILEIRLSPYYTLTAENGILFAFFHFCLNSIQNQQHSQESTAAAGAEAGAASDRHSLLLFVDTEREYFDTTNTRSGNAFPFLHSFPTIDPDLENVHQQMTILRDQILDTGFASNQLIWELLGHVNVMKGKDLLELLHLFQSFLHTPLHNQMDFLFISSILGSSRLIDYLDRDLPLDKKLQSIELLKTFILPLYPAPGDRGPHAQDSDAMMGLGQYSIIQELLSSLFMNLGRTSDSLFHYQLSFSPPLYSLVHHQSLSWKTQRLFYASSSSSSYRTWYFTIATQVNEKLENLLLSAKISGVEIHVLGLGSDLSSLDKTELYHKGLQRLGGEIHENDVIVLLDGYDTLLTPASRFIGQRLFQSPTPMIYGAESGLFPHVTASWLHHAGVSQLFPEVKSKKNEKWQSLFPRKYVNSGTFLGRAKETKEFLSILNSQSFYVFTASQIYREEQHLMTRYVLQHPELFTIDFSNEIFFSLYHFPVHYFVGFDTRFVLQSSPDKRITEAYDLNGFRSHCAAVLHGNGIQGKFLYRFLASKMREVYDTNYSSTPSSLHSLWDWWNDHVKSCD